jgi:hypothetical protein
MVKLPTVAGCFRLLPFLLDELDDSTFASQRFFYVVLSQDTTALRWILKLDSSVKLLRYFRTLDTLLLVSY